MAEVTTLFWDVGGVILTNGKLEECLFIDDRALNLECARLLGMRTIHYQKAAQLPAELGRNGVAIGTAS